MDPNIPQGQAAIGGMADIRQAMARRGMGTPTSPLNQVTPTAPSFGNAVPPSAAPQRSAMPMNRPGANPAAAGMGMGVQPESTIIIKALDNRLKMLGQQGQ